VVERIHRNAQGFLIENRWALTFFVTALLADAASTTHFMLDLGISAELHPLVRAASAAFGPFAGPMIGAAGKAMVCMTVAAYLRPVAVRILLGLAGLYLFAAWYDVWGIYWCV
jgi:hypothetical protein